MPPLMPDEDKNFGVSLVLDFGKWWRHVKTIYIFVFIFNITVLTEILVLYTFKSRLFSARK